MTCVCLCRVLRQFIFCQTAVGACKGRDRTAVSEWRRRQGRLREELWSVGRLRSTRKRYAASCIVRQGVAEGCTT